MIPQNSNNSFTPRAHEVQRPCEASNPLSSYSDQADARSRHSSLRLHQEQDTSQPSMTNFPSQHLCAPKAKILLPHGTSFTLPIPAMPDPYAAAPLDPHCQCLRLLELQPGNDTDTLKYTLRPCRLADSPPYTALSYTWGSDAENQLIELNGIVTPIRDNLWSWIGGVYGKSMDRYGSTPYASIKPVLSSSIIKFK